MDNAQFARRRVYYGGERVQTREAAAAAAGRFHRRGNGIAFACQVGRSPNKVCSPTKFHGSTPGVVRIGAVFTFRTVVVVAPT